MVRPQSNLWRIADVLNQTRVIYGDLSVIEQAENGILTIAPEVVFHLGWHGVASEHRDDLNQIHHNLTGTLRLLEYAQRGGCRCWVGVGSQAEYGRFEGVLHEKQPTQPITLYGVTKLCAGLLTRQLCAMNNVRYVWCRLLATYGPKDDPRHFIPTVIRKLLAGEKPSLTPGEQMWDYLHVADAATALQQLAEESLAEGVFVLGSGRAVSIRQVAETIRDLIDPQLPLGLGELFYRADQVMRLEADSGRLKAVTGWSPQMSLERGLEMTVAWYRNQI